MGTAGYTELLRQLRMFFELCDSVYLKPEAEGGRFGIYENRIRRLVNHIEAIGRGEPEGPLFAHIAPDLPVYLTALAESLEVGEITPFLSSCPRDLLVPRLKAVLRGPVLPSDENQSSNQARNIQFELYLAALLSRSGVSVSLGEPPEQLANPLPMLEKSTLIHMLAQL